MPTRFFDTIVWATTKRERSVFVAISITIVIFLSSILSTDGADFCSAALSLVGQKGFHNQAIEISRIKKLGMFRDHRVVMFQNLKTNQVVVLLGEAHFKKIKDTETIEIFAKRFSNIAVELVEQGDREKRMKWGAQTSSNISRALLLDSIEREVHLIDKKIPAILDPINMAIVTMGAAAVYLGYANIAMLTSGSSELLAHHLMSPPGVISIPLGTTIVGLALYSLDVVFGGAAHLLHKFKVGEYLPVTDHFLNKRNIYMVQKIVNLMNDPEAKRENLLVIVGRMHLPQMIEEMRQQGWDEVVIGQYGRP